MKITTVKLKSLLIWKCKYPSRNFSKVTRLSSPNICIIAGVSLLRRSLAMTTWETYLGKCLLATSGTYNSPVTGFCSAKKFYISTKSRFCKKMRRMWFINRSNRCSKRKRIQSLLHPGKSLKLRVRPRVSEVRGPSSTDSNSSSKEIRASYLHHYKT